MPERDELDGDAGVAPFWSGTITFGLVSIPVNLLAANRSSRVSLRMVAGDGTPLKRRYFAQDERALEWDEIVRGYELEKGTFVVVDDDELERLAPELTRDIDLRRFVKADEIDPMHFERAYFLTPAGNSTKAYRLLAQVMEESGRAGIATFVMRAREYLVAIFAENGILRAETLRFADELRTPEDVGLPEPEKPPAAEVKRIEKAISTRTEKRLKTSELTDSAGERILELVEKKLKKGEGVTRPERDEEDTSDVIDLMEALQRSLGGAGRSAPARRTRAKSATGLSELSKSELYAKAQELEIEGRSGMSKDELIAAIRRSA